MSVLKQIKMKKLDLKESSSVVGGDQCARLSRRAHKMAEKGRVNAMFRLLNKMDRLECSEPI